MRRISEFLRFPAGHLFRCLVELIDLAGIQTGVAGENEADHADKGEQVQIRAAEHLDAQHDGGDGGVGGEERRRIRRQRLADKLDGI